MSSQPIEVIYDGGVYLPEADLWLDPARGKPAAFVSHAHSDHFAPHGESICSGITERLIRTRYRHRGTIRGYSFGETFERGGFRFELLPAGHILGSAQIRVERLADGDSLLYTGDFKLRPGAASEPAECRPARTLIMETTFGLPKYRLPETEEVIAKLAEFARAAIAAGAAPVLGAYSLGKAQEVLLSLHRAAPELSFVLHRAAVEMTEIYRECGYPTPEWETFVDDLDLKGKVLIAPPNVFRSAPIRAIENRRTAVVSGWGADGSAKYRYGVDEVFPLSDHADYDDLLRYVEMVNPARVLTLHGFADEFAADLRRRGREAWSFTGANQLELALDEFDLD